MNYSNTCSLVLKSATLRLTVKPLGLFDKLFMPMQQKNLQERAGGIHFSLFLVQNSSGKMSKRQRNYRGRTKKEAEG